MGEPLSLPLDDPWADIRDGVAKLCEPFDNAYWNRLDAASEYPHEFVDALTEAGYLAALIPEEYGGAGLPVAAAGAILETIHAAGCNAAACHAQMYTMGTLLRHGSAEQKEKWLPGIASGALRMQAFGVTEPTTGSDTTQLKTRAELRGNKLRRQRPEGLDQPGHAVGPDAAAGAHHAGRRGQAALGRHLGASSSTCARPWATASSCASSTR